MPQLRTPTPRIPTIHDTNLANETVTEFIRKHKGKLLVITGAGVSTDSGIPDYRSKQGVYVRNPNHRPILYHELIADELTRQRYWVRGYLGWKDMAKAQPNATHIALARLIQEQHVSHLITQNVDHLHHTAGTPPRKIVELHGSLFEVECLDCRHTESRDGYQQRLSALNPQWASFDYSTVTVNPDGDVNLGDVSYHDFRIPSCQHCQSSMMKPKVIFFGESIPKAVHAQAEAMVRQADAVLVIGSSLATYSSFRLVKMAHDWGKPVGMLNEGATRADDLTTFKVHAKCLPVLEHAMNTLLFAQQQ
ncbi:Sir2 family [Hesseltinella vesiculosa]|uniref:Sir2 family n=1 Tax=Hesseltinella vesiculosa TaxID=101127 RepID=A0A1X2GNL0_9FUNG|nr:Sir2 family [Hesseltinella vesiculosa]